MSPAALLLSASLRRTLVLSFRYSAFAKLTFVFNVFPIRANGEKKTPANSIEVFLFITLLLEVWIYDFPFQCL